MNNIKKLALTLIVPITVICTACNKPSYNLTSNVIKSSMPAFNNITLEATNKEMAAAGFEYGDMINAKVYDKNGELKKDYNLAYVTNYNEAGSFNKCLCDYEAKNDNLNISPGLDNKGFDDVMFEGGTCKITLKEKAGYKKIRDNVDVTIKLTYEECGSNNSRYANVRDVVQLGTIAYNVKSRRLYRGSSPFNKKKNPERYEIADQMMRYFFVDSEISVSHEDDDKLKEIMNSEEFVGSHTSQLYSKKDESTYYNKKFFTNNLGNDFFDLTKGGIKICEIFDFIYGKINEYNQLKEKTPETKAPVFYIHCDEGKDRTGFLIMLIEALCGCSYYDLVNDFMDTFFNYYNISIKNNKEKYDAMAELTCYRNLYAFLVPLEAGETRIDKLASIDLYNFNAKEAVENLVNVKKVSIADSAKNYLKEILSIHHSQSELDDIVKEIEEYFKYYEPNR